MFQRCTREFVILYFLYIRSEEKLAFMDKEQQNHVNTYKHHVNIITNSFQANQLSSITENALKPILLQIKIKAILWS